MRMTKDWNSLTENIHK